MDLLGLPARRSRGQTDITDSRDSLTLGSIRVGGGENLAVTDAFAEHELYIIERSGVWHVTKIREPLVRNW